MLQDATAARAEMRAGRCDTIGMPLQQRIRNRRPAAGARSNGSGADQFPRQGQWDENAAAIRQHADTVALGADPVDADGYRLSRRRR